MHLKTRLLRYERIIVSSAAAASKKSRLEALRPRLASSIFFVLIVVDSILCLKLNFVFEMGVENNTLLSVFPLALAFHALGLMSAGLVLAGVFIILMMFF